MYDIKKLREPLHSMSAAFKDKMARLLEKKSRINETFLTEHLVPRMIVFVDESDNMIHLKQNKKTLSKQYLKTISKNVVLNINNYIAKYDYDIAEKLKANG
jgi:hypothetical protein